MLAVDESSAFNGSMLSTSVRGGVGICSVIVIVVAKILRFPICGIDSEVTSAIIFYDVIVLVGSENILMLYKGGSDR